MCLDESVQAQMREFGTGATKEMCSQNERNVEGNRMTMSATCKLGQTTMKTQSVMTFNGNAAYHMEGTATWKHVSRTTVLTFYCEIPFFSRIPRNERLQLID